MVQVNSYVSHVSLFTGERVFKTCGQRALNRDILA